jgi:hypothetical protein
MPRHDIMTTSSDVMIQRTRDQFMGTFYTVMETQELTKTCKHIVPIGTFETFEEAQDFADTLINPEETND